MSTSGLGENGPFWTSRGSGPRLGSERAGHRCVSVSFLPVAAFAGLILWGCGNEPPPPRLTYPDLWVGSPLLQQVRTSLEERDLSDVVELPDSLLAQIPRRDGEMGEVEFAQASLDLPGVVAGIGPASSRATLLVGPLFVQRKIPLLSPTATSSRIDDLGTWVFRLAPDEGAEGAFMVEFALHRLEARRVTLFYLMNDEYGIGLAESILRSLEEEGLAPVDRVPIIAESDMALRVSASLAKAVPDVVLVAARGPEASGIALALHAEHPDIPVIVGDGAPVESSFPEWDFGQTSEIYGVTWWHPDLPQSGSRDFAGAFLSRHGRFPFASEALVFDALLLLARAVQEAGPDPDQIRRYLGELGSTRPPFPGVTGPIAFGPDRPINLVLTRLMDETSVLVPIPETRQ